MKQQWSFLQPFLETRHYFLIKVVDQIIREVSPSDFCSSVLPYLPLPLSESISREHQLLIDSKQRSGNVSFFIDTLPFRLPHQVYMLSGVAHVEDERTLCLLMSNVTTQHMEHIELQKYKEMVDLALKGIRSAVFDHNLITDKVNYGPGFREYVGFDANVLEEQFRQLIHPEDREPAYSRHVEGINRPGHEYKNHYRLIDHRGDYHYYEVYGWRAKNDKGVPTRLVGNLINVDKEFRYKQELELMNSQLKAMLHNGLVHMVLLDLQGEVLYKDRRCKDYFDHRDIYKESGDAVLRFQQALDGHFVHCEVQRVIEGQIHWFDLMYTPVLNVDGELTNILLKFIDITKVKQSLQAEALAVEEFRAFSRLKNHLLNNLSHEIRTPLNGISGALQLLMQNALPEQIPLLEGVETSYRRLNKILTDFMSESARSSQTDTENSSICILTRLHALVEEMQPLAFAKGLAISIQVDIDVSDLPTYSPHLEASYRYLIENALEFTYEGSILIHFFLKSDVLRFEIKDTGIGFKPSELELIFMPFVHLTEGLYNGHDQTTIGLILAAQYIKSLGGTLSAQSKPGKGSTFVIDVPLC